MKKTDYGHYDDLEIYQLMNEPWEISDRPYLLHAAYALSCLSEALGDDSEEEGERTEIWGKKIPERILQSVLRNVTDGFNDAARHGTRVDVWGRAYSVRKANAYDPKLLVDIFDFPLHDGEYTVTRDGFRKLGNDKVVDFQKNKEALNVNKGFLRKVVKLAEDDDNDGWNKLTDMEVAMYCWAKFYSKYKCENEVQFESKYRKHLYVSMEEIHSCLNEYNAATRRLRGMYCFDHDKVMEWNERNGQRSVVDEITSEEADDYWYDVALKGSFKP